MARSIGFHDLGGVLDDTPLQLQEHAYALWEYHVHALQLNLVKKGLLTVDELRRGIEGLPEEAHKGMTYYEKWASSLAAICIERGTLTQAELEQQLSGDEEQAAAAGEDVVGPDGLPRVKFRAGDLVRVREENAAVRWRKPHLRTPGYIFGLVGTVERDCQGLFGNPEALAFRHNAPKQPLYRVRFSQQDVWEGYTGPEQDTIDVEVYQPWLLPATQKELEEQRTARRQRQQAVFAHLHAQQQQQHFHGHPHDHPHDHSHNHSHNHSHHDADHHHDAQHDEHHDEKHHDKKHHDGGQVHDHGDGGAPHVHDTRCAVEQVAADKEGGAQEAERRWFAEALIRAILKKGVVSASELREYVEMLDTKGKQGGGAALVARAWVDPDFKKRLLTDGNAAAAELGVSASIYPSSSTAPPPPPPPPPSPVPASTGSTSSPETSASGSTAAAAAAGGAPPVPQPPVRSGTILTVVENTPQVHNIVVCTLCSCYPLSVLGMSPSWYKSRAYRARTVRNPRAVLAEFGTQLPDSVAVAVHDSTADNRYLVLPQRPEGTEGWSEEQLRQLVSRDSMIGVALATTPPPHSLATAT